MHSAKGNEATRRGGQRGNWGAWVSGSSRGLALLVALVLLAPSQVPAQSAAPAQSPDAVIELWEQHWTLNADGSTVYHEKKHVRMNNERANGEFADPRITYNVDTDELEILVARTKLPDGSYCELPDYSHVFVSPDASAGWPAFASIRQHLLVISGIEPGCLVELEYKITSKPGSKPHLAADVRLDHRYPVLIREVSVEAPASADLRTTFTGVSGKERDATLKYHERTVAEAGGKPVKETARGWVFTDLPAAVVEPHSPPWQTSGMRFAFSTAGPIETWLKDRLGQIDAAADESELITKLAAEWTKDHKDAPDQLRALQEKLAARFTVVDFPVEWWSSAIRPASETCRGYYGLPEEGAAALLALARAVGLPVKPAVLVADNVWLDETPQDAMVEAYVVLLDGGKEPEIWDAHNGRIVRDKHWAGHTLLAMADGGVVRTPLAPWTAADDSRRSVVAKVKLKDDGTFTGDLALRMTGLFVSPEGLRSADAQKSRIGALLGHVLPDAQVESFAVLTLSDGEFEVDAKIKSSKALKKVAERYQLVLSPDGPFLADVPLPLADSRRTNPVRLAGAFDEQLELTVERPEKWSVEVQPGTWGEGKGDWTVEQSVTDEKNSLMLRRHTQVGRRELSAEEFLKLREALNELRSDHARTVLLKP